MSIPERVLPGNVPEYCFLNEEYKVLEVCRDVNCYQNAYMEI